MCLIWFVFPVNRVGIKALLIFTKYVGEIVSACLIQITLLNWKCFKNVSRHERKPSQGVGRTSAMLATSRL